jgi:hypothetical protein
VHRRPLLPEIEALRPEIGVLRLLQLLRQPPRLRALESAQMCKGCRW